MSRRFTRVLCAAAAAALAFVTMGSARAGAAAAVPAVPADSPAPGVTLGVAGEGNFWTDLFYTGTSGQVWMLHRSNMAQPVPVSLGGKLIGGPAAVWIPPGTLPISGLAVFGRGTDNALWWRHMTSSGWSGWASLGGVLTSKPAVNVGAAPAPDTLSVFARGANGAVYGRALHATASSGAMAWGSWAGLGGALLPGTAPASAGNASGLFVAAVGTDHAVWVRAQLAGKTPGPWRSIGGSTAADPAIAAPSPTAVAAFVRGSDNAAWYNEFFGSTSGVAAGWHSMHGALTSGLTAITQRELARYGQTSVFVLGTDSQPWLRGGTWPALSGWLPVPLDY